MDNVIFLGFADNRIPEFKEVKSKDWILFGEDNRFPDNLLYLYNKSSNHNAIVNGKAVYIYGKGFENGTPIINSDGETYNRLFKKLILDIELFGGCRIEVLWKIGGGAELRHIPFQFLRRSKELNGYWYAKDWSKFGAKEKPVFIPNYDPENRQGTQIIAYNEYRPGVDCYPLPMYFGALNDIETDVEISKYNLSIIKNGMFSSKMIVFNNGEPPAEMKREIERDFKKKFAGSENSGNFMLVFNQDPAKAPTVQDLSTTDLDKLFNQLNTITQGEIFSAHMVTSPMLFGIRTEGQLGGRTEMLEAYELFKNTYINEKQQNVEELSVKLSPIIGFVPGQLIPVEPIKNLSFTEGIIAQNLTQDEIRATLGFDPIEKPASIGAEQVLEAINSLSPLVANKVLESMTADEIRALIGLNQMPIAENVSGVTVTEQEEQLINENIKNLTGKQYQQLMRIIREFNKGKLTKEQATAMLKSGLGMSDSDVVTMLGISDIQLQAHLSRFTQDTSNDEELMVQYFSECGESKNKYIVLKSMRFDQQEMNFVDLSQIDSDILDLIKKDKRISAEDIADAIDSTPEYVNKRLKELQKSGVLTAKTKTIGVDSIIERAINPEVIDFKPKAETTEIFVRYTYEKRPEAKGGDIIDTTRPFCRRLIELDRVYTRQEIETISSRLGYSVFDRGGGFWGKKPHCRHEWRRIIVVKKK